jgi:hypothetical protein
MKYTTEDNFDFYSELNSSIEEEEMPKCMISHLPLTYNAITLPCKHTFNYMPLYKELCANFSHCKQTKLHCPYCRTILEKLIPYIPLPHVEKKIGVNYPLKNCMPGPQCNFMIKRLKKKIVCNAAGMESEHGVFCVKHFANAVGSNAQDAVGSVAPINPLATEYKKKTVAELRKMLRAKGLKVGGLKNELINRLLE